MKKPTLKEVQHYFKNAKEVRSQVYKDIFTLHEPFHFSMHFFDDNGRIIWSLENGYAEIITEKINNI